MSVENTETTGEYRSYETSERQWQVPVRLSYLMVLQMRGHGGNGGKSLDHAARTLRSKNYH